MPEGHILHRLAGLHRQQYHDHQVEVSSPQGRFTHGASLINQQIFHDAHAWGKHLFHVYDNRHIVHIHLGIYGRFVEHTLSQDQEIPVPRDQVRMRIQTSSYVSDLSGPTVCEVINTCEYKAIIQRLGPDPLRKDACPDEAWEKIHRSTRPLGALLLDQKIIAGIGNIYRSELLFRHHLNPYRRGKELTRKEYDLLWADTVHLMHLGLQHGSIIVVDPIDDHGPPAYAPGKPRTYVYHRTNESCRRCQARVQHALMSGRSIFWCPQCQPLV